jgi:hypothetical protein
MRGLFLDDLTKDTRDGKAQEDTGGQAPSATMKGAKKACLCRLARRPSLRNTDWRTDLFDRMSTEEMEVYAQSGALPD